MKLVMATWNNTKLKQMEQAFRQIPLKVTSLAKRIEDIEETALTFKGNALLKVEAATQYYGNDIIIGEDSGLSIDALGGFPGVRTARFSPGNDGDRAQQLVERLSGVPLSKRTAKFTSAVAIAFPDGAHQYSQGVMGGWIAKKAPATISGYGDIFLLSDGKVLSEHDPALISAYDHRQVALFQAKQYILEWLEGKSL